MGVQDGSSGSDRLGDKVGFLVLGPCCLLAEDLPMARARVRCTNLRALSAVGAVGESMGIWERMGVAARARGQT